MKCINLSEAFPGYQVDRAGKRNDPWLQVIPCKYGEIYPHGELPAVATNGRKIGLKVAKLPGAIVLQDGTDGMNIAFLVAAFPAVAKIVKPRRKRKVTAEQLERLARTQFKPAVNATSCAPSESEAA